MHIAISGNIGVGKSSLTYMLSRHYNWKALFEDVDNNPYINDFYEDMNRWAFNIQIYFLTYKLHKIQNIQKAGKNFFQDRSIYEDAFIFADNLNKINLLHERDFKTYMDLFKIVTEKLPYPDLIIYLKSNIKKIKTHILKRGREYEKYISDDYIHSLNKQYEQWISNLHKSKVLTIEIGNIDFVKNQKDFIDIVKKIDSYIK